MKQVLIENPDGYQYKIILNDSGSVNPDLKTIWDSSKDGKLVTKKLDMGGYSKVNGKLVVNTTKAISQKAKDQSLVNNKASAKACLAKMPSYYSSPDTPQYFKDLLCALKMHK